MTSPRKILNELKWRGNYSLELAEIWYVHMGAPNDTKIISGREIVSLDRSYMNIGSAVIPYHRIFKIIYAGKVIFERK
jgi:uncharacterized protein (UPF0248 family)